jgi:hypothetical protein
MSVLMVWLLLWRDYMEAKSQIRVRAGLLQIHPGYLLADTGYWKAAVMIIAAIFLVMLLITQLGKTARFEKGAEVTFSRAWQLLKEANKENRNVRPLPLSLAKAEPSRQSV